MNNLNIYKLPKNNLNNNEIKDNLIYMSPYQNNPLFSLGYHYYIGRTRAALYTNITKINQDFLDENQKNTNEFYYVVNNFEINISNYDEHIKIFKETFSTLINNQTFYKFWEIYLLFDIFEDSNLQIININDETNSAEIFRNKYFDKKDKIYNEYKKGIQANLIISNNNFNSENEFINFLILEIKNIIESQEKNGNLILRINDTFTLSTIKLLYILTSLYEKSYIYKPYFSRPSDSEKFIICKNYNSKDIRKITTSLNEILNKLKKEKDEYLSDIYNDLEISNEYLNVFKFVNIKLVNEQQILINEIIKYIKENNYFGDKYHEYRNKQIESIEFWIKNFLISSKSEFKSSKEYFNQIINSKIEKNNIDKDKFIQNLI